MEKKKRGGGEEGTKGGKERERGGLRRRSNGKENQTEMKLKIKAKIDVGNGRKGWGRLGGRERLIKRKYSTRKSNCVPFFVGRVIVLLGNRLPGNLF